MWYLKIKDFKIVTKHYLNDLCKNIEKFLQK